MSDVLPAGTGVPLLAAATVTTPTAAAENITASARLPALDGLRGIAVLVVFGMHTIGQPRGGAFGVGSSRRLLDISTEQRGALH